MRRNVLLLFVCAALLLTASPAFAGLFGDKFEDEAVKEEGAVKLVREVQQGGYDVINSEDLKAWIDSGKKMIIVDTMPYEASYKKNHIPGAVAFEFPVPLMETWDTTKTAGKTEADYEALLGPDKNVPIVVYCGFVKCTRSHNGALWAKKLGYTNVIRQPGGIFAWKGKGYPVETED